MMTQPPRSAPITAPCAQPNPVSREAVAAGSRFNTGDLFNGAREIVIDHNGREYRLRITQQGKLLLTA